MYVSNDPCVCTNVCCNYCLVENVYLTTNVIFRQCCCVETRNVSKYLLVCSDFLVFNDHPISRNCLVYNNFLVYNECMYSTTHLYEPMCVAINV